MMNTQSPPLLLIGRAGMLARAWSQLLQQAHVPFVSVDLPEFDLTRPASIHEHVRREPWSCIVNCAAYTDVDGAENNEALATAVNGAGVEALARAAATAGIPLIHYSTDYVFAGDATEPYRVDARRAPQGAYARSKLAGELALESAGGQYLLIRTSWLYAPWGKNFVRTIARLAREKPQLRVVNDQRGRPTSAQHLAAASFALWNRQARGPFHVCDGGECTWFEFAREIARVVNPACQVLPCTSAEYPSKVKRPAYSVLDLTNTEKLVGPMPPWQDNLAAVLRTLEP